MSSTGVLRDTIPDHQKIPSTLQPAFDCKISCGVPPRAGRYRLRRRLLHRSSRPCGRATLQCDCRPFLAAPNTLLSGRLEVTWHRASTAEALRSLHRGFPARPANSMTAVNSPRDRRETPTASSGFQDSILRKWAEFHERREMMQHVWAPFDFVDSRGPSFPVQCRTGVDPRVGPRLLVLQIPTPIFASNDRLLRSTLLSRCTTG